MRPQDVEDNFVQIDRVTGARDVEKEVTNVVDDLAGAMGPVDYVLERFAQIAEIERDFLQIEQRGAPVRRDRGERLPYFMRDRGGRRLRAQQLVVPFPPQIEQGGRELRL